MQELCEALAECEVATLGHTLDEGFIDPAISALQRGLTVVGPARTLELHDPDAYAVNAAIVALQPGEVLCIRVASGRHAPIGAVTATALRARGAAGVIVDGPVTDRTALEAMRDLPVYSRGVAACTTKRLDTAHTSADTPVTIGGVSIVPGDIVFGDENGVVRIHPHTLQPELIEQLRASDAAEPALLTQIEQGTPLTQLLALRTTKGTTR